MSLAFIQRRRLCSSYALVVAAVPKVVVEVVSNVVIGTISITQMSRRLHERAIQSCCKPDTAFCIGGLY